jgi:hypothetical protein
MPKFRFVGDCPRLYPQRSLEVAPGDVVELDVNPDEARFEPVTDEAAPVADDTEVPA